MKKRSNSVVLLLLLLLLGSTTQLLAEGRTLEEVPMPEVRRIVSLGPINTENVYLLGAEDRLVANTSYCVRPEAAREKEKIGSVMQVSLEKIISLRPDLVLATGLTQQQQLDKMRALGLRVVQFEQPSSFASICSQFLRLGRLLGLEERAREIVARARARVKQVQDHYAVAPCQKVFLQIGSQPMFSSVVGSFTNDYISYSGALNIAGTRSNGAMNYERVLAADPDVIIIAIMGSEAGVAARERQKWLRFNGMKAVDRQRIHVIDPDLVCSPSPVSFAEAFARIAALIHPQDRAGSGS